MNYRKTVHFTSLTAEAGATGESSAWKWQVRKTGTLVAASSNGGIVTNPSSPLDPVAGGAMRVSAKSKSKTAAASFGYFANCHPAGDNYKDNLMGQSLAIEVMVPAGWSKGYLEVQLATSFHPSAAGRPAGVYTLSYRFAPTGVASRSASGVLGVVSTPVQAGAWTSVVLQPSQDIAGFWPDLDVRDFGLSGITVNAVSNGDAVTGYVDYLRFTRSMGGTAQFDMQQDMMAALAPKYLGVEQIQGLEVSWLLPHINWFGGAVTLPNYGTTKAAGYPTFIKNVAIPQIHATGGLASYNHPYGYAEGTLLPESQHADAGADGDRAAGQQGARRRPDRGGLQRPPGGGLRPPRGPVGRAVAQRALPHRRGRERRPLRPGLAGDRQQLLLDGVGRLGGRGRPDRRDAGRAHVVRTAGVLPRQPGPHGGRFLPDGLGLGVLAAPPPGR